MTDLDVKFAFDLRRCSLSNSSRLWSSSVSSLFRLISLFLIQLKPNLVSNSGQLPRELPIDRPGGMGPSLGSEANDSGRDFEPVGCSESAPLETPAELPSRNTKDRHDWERLTEDMGIGVLGLKLWFSFVSCDSLWQYFGLHKRFQC